MLDGGKSLPSHPGYQAPEMNWDGVVPLPEPDTGVVGSGFASTSPHDVGGTAVTKDAARAGRRRDVSMFLGLKERARRGMGWGVGMERESDPGDINTLLPGPTRDVASVERTMRAPCG